MKKETWDAIETMFSRFPIMKAEGVEMIEIDAVCAQFGIPLPSDYREFIHRYGGAVVGPYPIFGLRRAEPMAINEGSVVDVTRRFRQKSWVGTEAWLVFSIDHAGNPVGLDRDGKVWISDHDARAVQLIANSFEDYLRQRCLKFAA